MRNALPHLYMSLAVITAFALPVVSAQAASFSQGDSGSAVVSLQKTLITKGYLPAGNATGYFGPLTEAGVKKFQCDRGIVCSGSSSAGYGVFGPQTQAALGIRADGTRLEVSAWIPFWRAKEGAADILAHLDQFTEINPFGYGVSDDGLLTDPMNINEEPWPSLIAAAQAKGVRVIPTIMWHDGAVIHRVLSDTDKRIALEDAIATLVYAEGFDGIDIDFEGKYAETKDYFSTFLRGLYQRMGKKWVMCTIEPRTPLSSRYEGTPPSGAGIYANDFVQINKYCDRVRIMAYDQGAIDVELNDENDGPYIPVADPKWAEKVMRLTAETIPLRKLSLGIPTYGYEYTVRPLTEGYRYDRQWSFNPRYALELAEKFALTPVRNSAGELFVAYQPRTMSTSPLPKEANTLGELFTPPVSVAHAAEPVEGLGTFNILWWSDARAIEDKIELAGRLGLRGISIFKIDGGEDPELWNILP